MKHSLSVLFFLFAFSLFAQNESQIDSLKKLGADSLIRLAIVKINDSTFNAANYDRITVKANKTCLLVSFGLSVNFISKKDCYYDAVTAALAGKKIGQRSIRGDCDEPEYYSPSESVKKKIQFVFDAINKSDEIGHLENNKISDDNTMEITEHSAYFYVEISNWSTFSHYKVDKGSGKISEANHKHYSHDETESEKEIWEIIK